MDLNVSPISTSPVVKPLRNRVSKACVQCRQRKIKCDGQVQCKHCKSAGKECIYPQNTIRKPKAKTAVKKVSKTQSMETLNNRIAKLEQLICNLTDKLVPGEGTADLSPLNTLEEEEESTVSSLETSPNPGSSKPSLLDPLLPSQSGFVFHETDGTAEPTPPGCSSTADVNQATLKSYSLEQYFGTHCTFHIFSDKSISWIKAKLRKKDTYAIIPLENLPIVFNICKRTYNEMFIDPPLRLPIEVEESLPTNPQLGFELLELFDALYLVSFLCDVKYVKELLQTHYANKSINRATAGRKIKYSEFLILNISLALCVASAINKRMYRWNATPSSNTSSPCFPAITSLKLEELIELQGVFFKNSIYYYHKISLLSEGIRSIQGILLLVIFLETSLVTSHVNYALSSLAVRFAQEIGLHRFESFGHLPEAERTFRRRIWWFCQYLDMELCYRNGKPPLVNDSDVSTLTDRDIDSLFKICHENSKDGGAHFNLPDEVVADIIENKHIHTYTGHQLMLLTRIRSKSYKELFSATVELASYNVISSTLKGINEEMTNLALQMDQAIRPRFYNDPLFSSSLKSIPRMINGTNIDSAYESVITIQLTYFLHLMTINRLPFQIDTLDRDENNPDSLSFRNLSLDSARTVLHICLSLDRKEIPLSFLNWIIFFTMSAFLNLLGNCVNHATSPDTMKDVSLLIDVSISFFGHFNRFIEAENPSTRIFHQRESMCDLVCRIMLRILVKIMEAQLNVDILEENEFLKNHLNAAEIDYPEIFSNQKEAILRRFGCSIEDGNIVESSLNSTTTSSGVKTPQWTYGKVGYVAINNGAQTPRANEKPPMPSAGTTPSDRRHPSLSNILHPNELLDGERNAFLNSNSTFSSDQFIKQGDQLDDDSVNNILFSQLYDLPNFFFDNGI